MVNYKLKRLKTTNRLVHTLIFIKVLHERKSNCFAGYTITLMLTTLKIIQNIFMFLTLE